MRGRLRWLRRRVARFRGRIGDPVSAVDLGDLPVSPGVRRDLLHRRSSGGRRQVCDPPSVPARQLDVAKEELGIGVELGGEARFYPLSALWRPHIVNDHLGGTAVTVTFCVNCRSGAVFDPVVDGDPLRFDVFGGYEGALVMEDHPTGTLWSQLSGDALAGPLAGRVLRLLPSELTTLGSWVERHPDATAPDPAILPSKAPRPQPARPTSSWRRTLSVEDHRLPERELVLGVRVGTAARAYVLDPTRPGPRVFEDYIGEVPVALLAPPGSWPAAYDRRLDGSVARLRVEGEDVIDETGSVFDGKGRGLTGPRAGRALVFLSSVITEWYAWVAHHPATDVVHLVGG